jgi:hypothetical protein
MGIELIYPRFSQKIGKPAGEFVTESPGLCLPRFYPVAVYYLPAVEIARLELAEEFFSIQYLLLHLLVAIPFYLLTSPIYR